MYDRRLDRRVEVQFPVRLPHEALHAHFTRTPREWDRNNLENVDWDFPAYTKHPLVRRHGNVGGIGLYRDKVDVRFRRFVN